MATRLGLYYDTQYKVFYFVFIWSNVPENAQEYFFWSDVFLFTVDNIVVFNSSLKQYAIA